MKNRSKSYFHFTIITNEGRFLNFASDRVFTLYHIDRILKQFNIPYKKCYIIDTISSNLIDLCIDVNAKMSIPPYSHIVPLNGPGYELISKFKIPSQITESITKIKLLSGEFLSKSEIPGSIQNDLLEIKKIQNSDFQMKVQSIIQTIGKGKEKLTPDSSFFELAKVSYNSSIERKKMIENNPLFQSIMICEPTSDLENKQLVIEVKVAFDFAKTNYLIKQFASHINSDQTANEVIEKLITQKVQGFFPDRKILASDCALQIPGTDEIIAGDYQLSHFIFIQKYLKSSKQTLKLNLIEIESCYIQVSHSQSRILLKSESSSLFENIESYLKNYLSHADEVNEFENKSKKLLIPHIQIKSNFSVIIEGFKFPENNKQIYKVQAFLCVGTRAIKKVKLPKKLYELPYATYGLNVDFKVLTSKLPRYTKIVIKIKNKIDKKNDIFGFASLPLFDRNGKLISGRVKIDFIFNKNCPNNPAVPQSSKSNIVCFLRFPNYPHQVIFDNNEMNEDERAKVIQKFTDSQTENNDEFKNELNQMKISISPLQKLTNDQKHFLIKNRWKLTKYSEYLPTFLRSFKSWNEEFTNELPLLLKYFEKPNKSTTILLLSGEFYDPLIRSYVAENLETWNDAELSLYMLQIVRSLEVEHENDSEIAKFLLKRAISEPKYLGLQLFWQLKALIDIPWMLSRVVLMIATLVSFSDLHGKFLFSFTFTEALFRICKDQKTKQGVIDDELPMLSFDSYSQLPIDPKLIVKEYVKSECFFADSSKKPLILSFKPADPFCNDNIKMMIKVNDDLRQDMITMQILNVMHQLWEKEGLNMRMKTYSVLATGDNEGIIEIVPNAVTISSIQKQKGKLKGVYQNDIISEWLDKQSKASGIRKEVQIENFKYSMAGYIVATYVLGIGDRHCSNMMIQKDGHFFHIDFGHFLGHFKTFIGIDRESNLFYFSDAFVHTLGGFDSSLYKDFENLCCTAFCIIRKNYNILITLLYLMKDTGIPELSSVNDIKYVENALMLDLSEDEACQKLKDMLKHVPTLKRTTVSDLCHQIQH